jgi:hypothetical protein
VDFFSNHWIQIDLGSEKEFNTYTLYNTQSKEGFGNATEWEILTSNDGQRNILQISRLHNLT